MKKLDTKNLTSQLTTVLNVFQKYSVFIAVLVAFGIFGFLINRIRVLATTEPSESALSEKLGEQKPITIDKSAVEKVQQLQATNVEVKALLNQGRDNPFQE